MLKTDDTFNQFLLHWIYKCYKTNGTAEFHNTTSDYLISYLSCVITSYTHDDMLHSSYHIPDTHKNNGNERLLLPPFSLCLLSQPSFFLCILKSKSHSVHACIIKLRPHLCCLFTPTFFSLSSGHKVFISLHFPLSQHKRTATSVSFFSLLSERTCAVSVAFFRTKQVVSRGFSQKSSREDYRHQATN